jgi:SAM-dependent methyltransferase
LTDVVTAAAFAESWNRAGTVYTREQYLEWLAPIEPRELSGRDVLELGFGNGSLLVHTAAFAPRRLAGVELGDTLEQTRHHLAGAPFGTLDLHRGDLTTADLGQFDFVYCIGVLHHLTDPRKGFDAVLRATRPGGRFHCWVYAREGNAIVRMTVEPLRRLTSRLPWWFTKYAVALPLVAPYFVWAKIARLTPALTRRLPLGEYTLWIAKERFRFFHHVAFDQLLAPRTAYIDRPTIDSWLADERVDPSSVYVIHRNGNSWKFGGRRR